MKENNKIIIKKGDVLLLLSILLLVAFCMVVTKFGSEGQQVHVTAMGVSKTYSLSDNQRIVLRKDTESENILIIKDGQVYMESADCPDQVCVNHKPISKNGEMIICLPNEVFVEVDNDMENEIDN